MIQAFEWCNEFDKECPFRFEGDRGIGEHMKVILCEHWHNILVTAGLIENVKVPSDLKDFITSSEYYLKPLIPENDRDTIEEWLRVNSDSSFTIPSPMTVALTVYLKQLMDIINY